MATCIEVAKKAGVSRQTVSRVINNSPNVTEETRRKVLQAIEELSYHPNMLARALKSAKSHRTPFLLKLQVLCKSNLASKTIILFYFLVTRAY